MENVKLNFNQLLSRTDVFSCNHLCDDVSSDKLTLGDFLRICQFTDECGYEAQLLISDEEWNKIQKIIAEETELIEKYNKEKLIFKGKIEKITKKSSFFRNIETVAYEAELDKANVTVMPKEGNQIHFEVPKQNIRLSDNLFQKYGLKEGFSLHGSGKIKFNAEQFLFQINFVKLDKVQDENNSVVEAKKIEKPKIEINPAEEIPKIEGLAEQWLGYMENAREKGYFYDKGATVLTKLAKQMTKLDAKKGEIITKKLEKEKALFELATTEKKLAVEKGDSAAIEEFLTTHCKKEDVVNLSREYGLKQIGSASKKKLIENLTTAMSEKHKKSPNKETLERLESQVEKLRKIIET